MKKIIFFLCSLLLFGFNYPNNNNLPIIIHFEQILNEYRYSNGLSKVVIDESIKEFADERSRTLVQDYSHNGFNENIYSYISDFTYGGENIVKINIPKKDGIGNWFSSVKEIEEILNKMSMETSTDNDIAKYCFLKWKHSESHNELLVDEKIKRFYLSYQKTENYYYFSFIALN